MKDIRIELEGPGRGRVYIDGVEQTEVRGGKIEFRAGEPNIVTLEYYARTVNAAAPVADTFVDVTTIGSGAREFKNG